MKKGIFFAAFALALLPLQSTATIPPAGALVKGGPTTVYYYATDGNRYAFFDPETYFSWFTNFSAVQTISDSELSTIPLRGLVTHRPGIRLVKIQTDPKVYAVAKGGVLRWLKSEAVANQLYGANWNKVVVDVSDSVFINYTVGDPIETSTDFNPELTASQTMSIDGNLGLAEVSTSPKANTEVGGSIGTQPAVEVVAQNLSVPWDIAFLPDGDMLVTERPGVLRRFGNQTASINIPLVKNYGEGGLMGMALHPNFATNHWLYIYFTAIDDGQKNRVVRYKFENNQLIEDRIIIDNIPSAIYHDGGQIAFGPDGMLYLTTGDANSSVLAQDISSLAGKTLRLTADGAIPTDNPFGTAVWSYGHRNAQGIAWDSQNRMWQTEHGRSGAVSGFDELNLVEKAKNYGWPNIEGNATRSGMMTPVLNSGSTVTWAPSGMAYTKGRLFFAGLKGESLYEATPTAAGGVQNFKAHFVGTYGRLRAVVVGPNGDIYVTTSNTDGRGTIRTGDDKILRINPDILK